MPDWPDVPEVLCGEPPDDRFIGPDELSPADPLWDEFYAMPFRLPPDPETNWQLLLS